MIASAPTISPTAEIASQFIFQSPVREANGQHIRRHWQRELPTVFAFRRLGYRGARPLHSGKQPTHAAVQYAACDPQRSK